MSDGSAPPCPATLNVSRRVEVVSELSRSGNKQGKRLREDSTPNHRTESPKVYLMATSGCAPVKFFCTSETAFYFEAVEINGRVDEDAFRMSSYPAAQNLIRSKTNKFLILTVEEQFALQNLTTEQKYQPEYKFNIKTYNNNAFDGRTGRAVMLYANKGGKKVVVCCNENHEIHPVEMDLPQQIEESGHKAVFYKKPLPKSNYLLLESSLYPTEFLGFEPDENNQTLSKLVLFHKGQDEVDERCEFSISVDN